MKISVSLDSIIWGIQYQGGISNYWKKISNFFNKDNRINSKAILPNSIKYLEYSDEWLSNSKTYREHLPPSASRYCDVFFGADSEIFHSSYYRTPLFSNAKYVVTVYDFIYERYANGPRLWLHSYQKARSLHKADVVICISDATRKDVINFYPQISPSKIKTIYLGVDNNKFYPDLVDFSVDLSDVVLFVGQRSGYKRFDLAIASVAACAGLRLGVVGLALTSFELSALNKNIPGRWIYFGAVDAEALRQLYSAAFAFIFPSDFEGFGLPVLEAMACGCPVVASNKGSIPEVGGGCVSYAYEQNVVSYARCLMDLYQHGGYRESLILGGVRHAKLFTWEKTLNSTLETYIDLIT